MKQYKTGLLLSCTSALFTVPLNKKKNNVIFFGFTRFILAHVHSIEHFSVHAN